MTDKHTPGPWLADFGETTSVRLSDGSRVATVNHLRPHSRVAASEAAANARVIAASPEMWDLVVAGVDNLDFTTGDEELTAEEVAWRRKAVALIAKVRGTQ
jgi:hypothetical protein